MAEARYRIGAAARLSGLSTHVIRIWERRYGALQPDRSGGGARLYSDAEIERLRLLRNAVEHGHTISQVATLPADELLRIAGREPAKPPAVSPGLNGSDRSPADGDGSRSEASEFVAAVRDFDLERAERVLDRAAVRLSPRALVMDVLASSLQLVGAAWASGELCVASEHLASALVRDRAGSMLRECSPDPGAATIVLTTPVGEQHELGALLAAVTVAMSGFRAVYLGPNLPVNEIVLASARTHAVAVALSLVSLSAEQALVEVDKLRQLLPERTLLLLGGANAATVAAQVQGSVEIQPSLPHLERWLVEHKAELGARAG